MTERYNNRTILLNSTEEIQPFLKDRDLKQIQHYSMGGLLYPTDAQIGEFSIKKELWIKGSSLWKVAAKHYNGRGNMWWVIAHFNKKPTDQHFYIGEVVLIPFPLDKVLQSYGL